MAKKITYSGCPFCAWYRYTKDEPQFDKVDSAKVNILSKRIFHGSLKGSGKRGGHIEVVDGIKLKRLPERYKEQIRNQARKILAELGE